MLEQNSFRRAWNDSEAFRKESTLWFWGGQLLGALLFGAYGGWVAFQELSDEASKSQEYWVPALGGITGVVVGLVGVFGVILVWNLLRAPYRQRNDLRQEIRNIQAEADIAPSVCDARFVVQDHELLFDVGNRGQIADFTLQYSVMSRQDTRTYDGIWRDTDKNVTPIDKGGRKAARLGVYNRTRASPPIYQIHLLQLHNNESVEFAVCHYYQGASTPDSIKLRITLTANPSLIEPSVADCEFRFRADLAGLDIVSQQCPAATG